MVHPFENKAHALQIDVISRMFRIAAIERVPFVVFGHIGRGGHGEIHLGETHAQHIGRIAAFQIGPVLHLPRHPFLAAAVMFDAVGDAVHFLRHEQGCAEASEGVEDCIAGFGVEF